MFFFFFQAEDGIRDKLVTGVQTCALPILQASDPHAFIVQFIGPIKAAWLDQIRGMGASPQFHVANAAYTARMDAPTARQVASLPFVNWVGPYQPAYKISKALSGTAGLLRIAVLGFDDVSPGRLADEVNAAGGAVFSVTLVPSLAQAFVDASLVDDIARIDDVAMVYNDPLPQPLDMKAGVVYGSHRAWYKETSGLPSTLTGVSN